MWFSKGMVPGQNVEVSYLPGSLVEYKCPNTSDNVGYSMYVQSCVINVYIFMDHSFVALKSTCIETLKNWQNLLKKLIQFTVSRY